MGTSNFHNGQASRIFAIDTDDEFAWNDTRDNVMYELLEIDKNKSIDWEFVRGDDVPLDDELRSFPATSIGQMYSSVHYGGMDYTITLIPKTVGGYYSGFNLDFEIRIDNDQGYGELINDGIEYGVSKDDMEYMFEEYEYQEPLLHGDTVIEKLNDKILDGVTRLEKVFAMYSDQLNVVARFSNGEVMYEKV